MAPAKEFKKAKAKTSALKATEMSSRVVHGGAMRSKLRYPNYPPGRLFGYVWLACLEGDTFVFDAEKILHAVEVMLDCKDRSHGFFLDMKQALHILWPVSAFKVADNEYADAVGAKYPTKDERAKHEEITGKTRMYIADR